MFIIWTENSKGGMVPASEKGEILAFETHWEAVQFRSTLDVVSDYKLPKEVAFTANKYGLAFTHQSKAKQSKAKR